MQKLSFQSFIFNRPSLKYSFPSQNTELYLFPPFTNELNKIKNDQDCQFPSLFLLHSKSLSSAYIHAWAQTSFPLQLYSTLKNIPKCWRQCLRFYLGKVTEAKKMLKSFCRDTEEKKKKSYKTKVLKAHILGEKPYHKF